MRPSRTHRVASFLVGLALIGGAGWFVTNTTLFHMSTLEVTGNRHLSDADVASLGGLSASSNVLWLRTGAVADRIERDPWILRAQVSRTLPGTLSVSIEERRPAAVIDAGGALLLVAGDGMILGPARPKARLPVIHVPGAPVAIGSRLAHAPAELVVARSLPAAVRGKVERIVQSAQGLLSLLLRDGVEVLYGDASEAGSKGRALASLVSWAKERGIRADYIDVRAPAAPAIFPAGAAGPVSAGTSP